jgi:ABC-2 type transport system permease protein
MTAVTLSPTVVRLGTRSVFGHKRGILLFLLPVVLIGLAVLIRVLAGEDGRRTVDVLQSMGLTVVVPLVALLATTGLFAPEIDDGSVAYLLAKPISRHTIVLSKLLVAIGCVFVFAVVPMFVAAMILLPSEPELALAFAVGSLAGGSAYCALFALLSVLTRHAVVIGLLYLLVWEGLLGGLLDGVRWLSVTRWARAITEEVSPGFDVVENLGPTYAVVASLVLLVLGTWFTGRRLRGFNLTGDE